MSDFISLESEKTPQHVKKVKEGHHAGTLGATTNKQTKS